MGVQERMPASHGTSNESEPVQPQGFHKLPEVLDEPVPGVAVGCPFAVTVAPLVQGEDVVLG